jgi:glucoamylase
LEGKVETEFTIVIGFGRNANEAGMRAKASLLENYDKLKSQFNKEWQRWQRKLFIIENGKNSNQLFSLSASILKVHESKRHPGALIASLSIPWGVSKGDDELGGYHLVWPRDLVQTAGGLLAAKANTDAKRVLNYLLVTQEQDGHWCQNMWLDGSPYWRGIQMDQTASPILLVDLIHREITLSKHELNKLWPMIKKAAIYIVHNGPTTEQDRWEENAGFSTYTIAVEISALLIAAEFARNFGEIKLANFLCEVADSWNSRIEDWCYVKNTALARKNNVEGYYVRINTQEGPEKNNEGTDILKISNRVEEDSNCPASEMVSPDALALVRFGLRSANDPKILNTVKVIDNTLQYKGEKGPLWYRYNYDGYGEHADGNPFNGIGIGRPWPLLTGERGHYEVAKGDIQEAEKMLKTLENYAGENCLIPEQIWDSKDILEKELIKDKPSGAAMPLAWAHAEYIKLYRSILSKKIFDMPSICEKRYIKEQNESFIYIVNLNKPLNFLSENKIVRFVYNEKFKINIRTGDNQDQTLDSIHISSNLYYTDLITKNMKADSKLELLIINSKNELPIGQKIFIKIKPEKLKLEDSFAETIDY